MVFILGILSGWFMAKKYFQPTPPDPDKPSVVTIVKGQPGVITVADELFYRDYFTALITSSGYGQAEYRVNRPDKWREPKKKHFVGFGLGADVGNQGLLYGGFVQYRYNLYNNISTLLQADVAASGNLFNAGIKIGVEIGVK